MRRPRLFAQKRYRQLRGLEAVVNKTFQISDSALRALLDFLQKLRGFIPDSYIRAGGRFSQMRSRLWRSPKSG